MCKLGPSPFLNFGTGNLDKQEEITHSARSWRANGAGVQLQEAEDSCQ